MFSLNVMFFNQVVTLIITVHIFNLIHISVTESGLGYYGLQPIVPGSGYEPVVTGTFAGLAILTTSKSDQCCFLEMRGIFNSYLSQYELYTC